MTDKEIYKLWTSKTSDKRYFRPRRWEQLRKVIESENVKSVLEFGSGVSTLLFNNLGLNILSIETDETYIKFMYDFHLKNVFYKYWDNKFTPLPGNFDLSLVDGINPRTNQLSLAIRHSTIIAVDDFVGRTENLLLPQLEGTTRIDDRSTFMAIFKVN